MKRISPDSIYRLKDKEVLYLEVISMACMVAELHVLRTNTLVQNGV